MDGNREKVVNRRHRPLHGYEVEMGTNERRKKLFIKQAVALAVLVVVITAAAFIFLRYWRLSELVQAQFINANGTSSPVLYLEVAATPAERTQGLMYRRDLAEDGGMLFVYDQEAIHPFWMKNTYIPLDIIHVGRDGKVVGISENTPVLNEESRKVSKPDIYVVEVSAGSSKKWQLQPGSRLEFRTKVPNAK